MRFLIKFPTRGRPEYFKRAIRNIVDTISTDNYQIIVSIDDDDTTMLKADILGFVSAFPQLLMFYGQKDSKISAINRDMQHADEWDVILVMSDDMHFTTGGWDEIMVKGIQKVWGKSLDFFAHFNDGYAGEALPTMPILGRKYYERDNYVYHPSYKSFSCDAEAMYVAMLRKKHHYFDEVLFLHQHPSQTPMPNDNTYHVNSLATPHDTKNYFERLNNNFGEPNTGKTPFDKWKT